MKTLRCFPRLARIGVEIDHMMAWFVAMPVFAYPTVDVGDAFALIRFLEVKECVELRRKLLLSAHELDKAGDVLRNIPRILPARSFGKVVYSRSLIVKVRIEWRMPPTLGVLSAHQTFLRVKEVLITRRPRRKRGEIGFLSQRLCHLRDTIIVVGVLKRFRDRLVLLVEPNPTQLRVGGDVIVVRIQRCCPDSIVGSVAIKSFHP